MVTGINDRDLLKKKHKLDKTVSVRLKWVATQSSVVAASDRYTRNCSDIERTSGGGEHERGYRHSGKRIREGGSLPRKFLIYGCLYLHF